MSEKKNSKGGKAAATGRARVECEYTDKHVGPKEEVGNNGGSLSNRLRTILST